MKEKVADLVDIYMFNTFNIEDYKGRCGFNKKERQIYNNEVSKLNIVLDPDAFEAAVREIIRKIKSGELPLLT